MSFFHKKNGTNCLGHHYAIWTSDLFFTGPKILFRLALISGTVFVFLFIYINIKIIGHRKINA